MSLNSTDRWWDYINPGASCKMSAILLSAGIYQAKILCPRCKKSYKPVPTGRMVCQMQYWYGHPNRLPSVTNHFQ